MQWSIVEVVTRLRLRVDAMSRLARRFLDEPLQASLDRVSTRLADLANTLAVPNVRTALCQDRLVGHLERLGREVAQLRVDDPTAVARVAWVLAEIEEFVRRPAGTMPLMPVYTAQ